MIRGCRETEQDEILDRALLVVRDRRRWMSGQWQREIYSNST